MAKQVVVIASGETERRVLTHLMADLNEQEIMLRSVIIPSRHRDLKPHIAIDLIQSEFYGPDGPPEKFVILIDADGKAPSQVLDPFREEFPKRLSNDVLSRVQYAYAQWHLEAWYFADARNLRSYFGGRALGNVDSSQPDEIENPKLHLKHLLGGEQTYTARISEEIAARLDARTIAQRSPSFNGFLEAVKNGMSSTVAE